MDDGYPDPDEEFEALYADELEAMREHEQENVVNTEPKSKKSLTFATPKAVNVLQDITINNTSQSEINRHDISLEFENDFQPIQTFENEIVTNSQVEIGKSSGKRTYEELFGDIDDLDLEFDDPLPKKAKTEDKSKEENDLEQKLAVIEHILEMRRMYKQKTDGAESFDKCYASGRVENLKDNLSYRRPRYPYETCINHEGDKVFVRCHTEDYMDVETANVMQALNFDSGLGQQFKDTWKEAREMLEKSLQAEENSDTDVVATDNSALWVDMYKPSKYLELLSDESTNRTILRWLKLWDKVVFNRRPKVRANTQDKFDRFRKKDLITELDETGRPQQKIVLLCGPPGLGKTTLAHLVAKHAGYNPVEINASDDRSVEHFKTALENSTQMSSVLDRENRPNCLIFDEIDGAPPVSIEFLIKYATGQHMAKAKKGTKAKAKILKRPIICICNDVYVPALRSLRQMAFVVNFPPTSSVRLANRLQEISKKESIQTDSFAMLSLSEKSKNDIRACLSVLHFFKTQKKPVTLSDVENSSIGQKDCQKGLFKVWQDIFQIERPKNNEPVTLERRWKQVIATVTSFGDYERLAQGVYENFNKMEQGSKSLSGICHALEWFCFFDILNKEVMSTQNYAMGSYMPYAFVVWHIVFGIWERPKLSYPSTGAEVRAKLAKTKGLLGEVLKGMQPYIRAYTNESSINLDVLPLLSSIVAPNVRPVNSHLFTATEKEQLERIVSTMIDYNLTYLQERTPEGTYVFNFDPNIGEIVSFSTSKKPKRVSHESKQLIAHFIDVEKMHRLNQGKNMGPMNEKAEPQKSSKPEQQPTHVPNHLQQLKAKTVADTKTTKTHFLMVQKKKTVTRGTLGEGVLFRYKEGYTNAVKRHRTISTWL